MKIFLLSTAMLFVAGARAQVCDSIVPTYTVDFTGNNAGTSWTSPNVARLGHCCTTSIINRCIQFFVATDSNTCGLAVYYYISPTPGILTYQLCCNDSVPIDDTTFVNPGIHR